MRPKIDVSQRRARLGLRHLLAAPGPGPGAVAEALVALHATDPATVHLAIAARTAGAGTSATEAALYDERTLLRLLGMRRTMFVVGADAAPAVQSGCALDIAVRQRALLVKHLTEQAEPVLAADPGRWLGEVEEAVYDQLAARGSATAQELAAAEPRLRQQLVMAPGKPYETKGNITSRVLFLLAADGRIVRGRPRGSWLSTQYHWSTMRDWMPGGLPVVEAGAARVELARRWLAAYGPATVTDLRWWTGWSAGQTKKALTALDPLEVDLDGGAVGIVLPEDVEPVPEPEPWVALLPALDPTPMGWAERDWYLDGHRASLFDRSGNIGPSVWADGRIVGGWAQDASGDVVYRLLTDIGSAAEAAVRTAAEGLSDWLGAVRVTPRFRTPLERELAGATAPPRGPHLGGRARLAATAHARVAAEHNRSYPEVLPGHGSSPQRRQEQ